MAKRKLADASINQFLERRGGAHVLSLGPGQCSDQGADDQHVLNEKVLEFELIKELGT